MDLISSVTIELSARVVGDARLVRKKTSQTPSGAQVASKPKIGRRFRPKKGRPDAAQVFAIDRTILDAGMSRFLADGFGGASMDAVALAAGVSKATLYSRYPNKESLFRAVVEDRVETWYLESGAGNRVSGDTLEKRLKHQVRKIMSRGVTSESRAFGNLISGAVSAPPGLIRMVYELRYERTLQSLSDEIEEFARIEARPVKDPESVASTLMASLMGWLRLQHSLGTASEREAVNFGHRVVDLLLEGRAAW